MLSIQDPAFNPSFKKNPLTLKLFYNIDIEHRLLEHFLLVQYWGKGAKEYKGCRKYETLTLAVRGKIYEIS
jgi:hypothetical protein